MRMTAYDQGKKPAMPSGDDSPPAAMTQTQTQRLVQEAVGQLGTLAAVARAVDVAPSAPGHWLAGRHTPTRRYRERLETIVKESS